jgi:two-component system, OmpR family, sensor kinase
MRHARSTGFWQSLKRLPDRTPLRTKMITAVLALVAFALVIISVAGVSLLRDNLLNRADAELALLFHRAQNNMYFYPAGTVPPGGGQHGGYNFNNLNVGERQVVEAITPSGTYWGSPYGPGNTDPDIPASGSWLASHALKPVTVPAESGGDRWRVVVEPDSTFQNYTGQQFTGTLVVGIDVSDVYSTIGSLTMVLVLISLAILLLLGVVGIAVIRASLRPLTEIEETAGAIAAGDLTRRVPERDPRTEVGSLGRSLNIMLSQIESAFRAQARSETAAKRSEERMRQFLGDASHELRTPLTALRGFAEYYRQRGGVRTAADVAARDMPALHAVGTGAEVARNGPGKLAPADLDRIMRRLEQESARMGVLVEDMLLLARLDQQRPLERQTVDLLALAADAVHDARVVAPSRSINLTVGAGAALLVIGDEVRLRQVIGNLMNNALSHTPDGTPIEVLIRSGYLDEAPRTAETAANADLAGGPDRPGPDAVLSQPGEPRPGAARRMPRSAAVLEVTDHGPGLTREQAQHVFERFYRADQARTSGGSGLGLAIVAALVAAHGGSVWVSSEPGSGATFSIALPLAPEAAQDAEDDHAGDREADSAGEGDRQADDTVSWADSGIRAPGSAA